MSLRLPGERESVLPTVLAIATVILLASLGCSGVGTARTIRAASFRNASITIPANTRVASAAEHLYDETQAAHEPIGAGTFVTRALVDAGLRFGTDGSVGAVFAYLSRSQTFVAPSDIRPGDVVFFELDGSPQDGCRGQPHAGVVESVDPAGRVTFLEARDGRVRRSYLHARRVVARRDEEGRILNSFLRPKRITDPSDARYFAGDMLCAVARVGL